MSYAKQVTFEIFKQFGGQRAMAMIGGSGTYGENFLKVQPEANVVNDSPFLAIHFKAKSAKVNGKSPNVLYIVYDVARDLYNMYFARMHGMNFNFLEDISGVYFDQLQEMFEEKTGLYLSL